MLSHVSLRKNDKRELSLPVFPQPGLNSVCEFGGSWGPVTCSELRAVPAFPLCPDPRGSGSSRRWPVLLLHEQNG